MCYIYKFHIRLRKLLKSKSHKLPKISLKISEFVDKGIKGNIYT